jgi:hypothetical protein
MSNHEETATFCKENGWRQVFEYRVKPDKATPPPPRSDIAPPSLSTHKRLWTENSYYTVFRYIATLDITPQADVTNIYAISVLVCVKPDSLLMFIFLFYYKYVYLKSDVVWDITQCILLKIYWPFGGKNCFHFQITILLYTENGCSAFFSAVSVHFYKNTLRHVLQDSNVRSYRHGNLKAHHA